MAIVPDAKIEQIHEDVIEIKILLKGYNGYPGLCQRHENLALDYYNMKRRIMCVFYFLVGAGILTGGTIGIVDLVKGG